MGAYAYACMCGVWVSVGWCVRAFVRASQFGMCGCLCACACVCWWVRACVHLSSACARACARDTVMRGLAWGTHTHTPHTQTPLHTRAHTPIMYTRSAQHTHTHIHTHTHAHIHIHTHTSVRSRLMSCSSPDKSFPPLPLFSTPPFSTTPKPVICFLLPLLFFLPCPTLKSNIIDSCCDFTLPPPGVRVLAAGRESREPAEGGLEETKESTKGLALGKIPLLLLPVMVVVVGAA